MTLQDFLEKFDRGMIGNIRRRVMDKVAKYREYVQQIVSDRANSDTTRKQDVEVQLVMDTVRDHYQWMNVGWEEFKRVYHCFIHLDIKDGKIWIQQNWTEDDLAADLVEMGVPREDIVLGLHPPYKRPYTDYGVA
jgi:XisI protein